MNMFIVAALFAVGISMLPAQPSTSDFGPQNPFFAPSTLPFQAPPFDKIKDTDYQPAIEAGMAEQRKEMQAIADDPQPPTFENTFIPMEKSGELLRRSATPFFLVSAADTNPTLEKARAAIAPQLAAHSDAIRLNDKLFQRVKAIYDQRQSLKVDPQSLRLVEVEYQKFVLAGANLSEADKTQLKKLNEELASLSNDFNTKLLAATKGGAYVTTDKSALAGFGDARIAAAVEAAKGRKVEGYVIPLQNTTQQPDLVSLSNRSTREALFSNSWNRAERGDANDTRDIISRIAQLRAQKAKLLGYPDFAAWKLVDQMANTPEAALKFMDELVPGATGKAAIEAQDIQAVIDAQKGGFKVQPWDWDFYAEQVRKAKYDLDEEQVKPYFELNNVLVNGVFYAANQLYGITFKERKDIPVYAPEMRVFEVFNADGSSLALFYCDYFKRDNKQGGAWMDELVTQSKLMGTKPVVVNVANFAVPASGEPALITADDVKTMFHEFGHALHGLLSAVTYPWISGTNVATDFVELPSQLYEHWLEQPDVLRRFARHYQTGTPMPEELLQRLIAARNFNQGFATVEYLASAIVDLDFHSLEAPGSIDPTAFEASELKRIGMPEEIAMRHRPPHFDHVFSGGGYAAAYYSYMWSEVLDADAFAAFEEAQDIFHPPTARRLHDHIYSAGGSRDPAALYESFRGRLPTPDALLRRRGLLDEASARP